MNCNCENLHKGISLASSGVLTVTNPNNISNFEDFNLVVCLNPNNFITGEPLPYQITINGVNVPVWDIWGYPIKTNRLCPRKLYKGKYVSGTGITTHITLANVCCTIADALGSTVAVATDNTTTGD